MNKIVLTFICILTFIFAHAQFPTDMMGGGQKKIYDGKISGTLIDNETKQPVEFASIGLYKAGTEKPLDGTVTDEKGFFKLKDIKPGKYKVTITFVGYLTQTFDSIEINDKKSNIDLGKIFFKQNTKALKEATVEGEAPLIETKIDKIVYNNEKDITSKGGNATDVLRKVPMVNVDLDGNVMLQGTQNVKILINNKPSSIMAASVADAMKMIPADEISKVEVITSPSAKYDAEGTGGIINIITKKKNIQGTSGMINLGIGTRSSNLFGNVNYRHDRMGVGLNFGGFGYTGHGDLTATRISTYDTLVTTLSQDGTNKLMGYGPFGQFNFDYDINSKNSITASFRLNGFFNNTKSDIVNNSVTPTPVGNFENSFTNNSKSKTGGLSYDANVDYKRTFKKPDQEFTLSAQMTNNNKNTDYDIINSVPDSSNYQSSINKSTNKEATFQADYTHPFTKKTTLEAGAKSILRNVLSDYNYQSAYNDGVFYDDTSRNNTFDYNQNIYAGYAQFSTGYKKWGFKFGGRYEYTYVSGKFDQIISANDSSFSSNYDNLIPYATVSYSKVGKYSLKLSYTQRIQRPSMTYLNPYVNSSDPTNITYGNPDLKAETSHSFELAYNMFKKFGSIITTAYHRYTDNAIESYKFVDYSNIRPVTNTTYGNIGKNYSTGASINLQVLWKMKIMLGSNFNIWYYKVVSTVPVAEGAISYNDGVNYAVSLYGSYKFNDKWGVQAFGSFNGPKYSLQGKSTSFYYYNLSARRSFKKDRGGVGFGFDNFATPYIHFKSEYSGSDFTYNSDNKIFFIGVRVSFDYRFGKMDFSSGKKKIKNDDLKKDDSDNGMGGGMMK